MITLTGAILLIQAVRIVLPLGSAGKYVSFVLGLFFMAAALDAVGGISLTGEEILPSQLPQGETAQLEEVQQQQIFNEYAKQLSEDFRRTLPQLAQAQLFFDFSVAPFGEVQGLRIVSSQPASEAVMNKIAELYGISREVITWETE